MLGAIGLATEPAIVIDPLNHFRTDPDKVAVPYYPPHPITERIALTVFPQVRPIHAVATAFGVNTSILATSSQDSYRRPPSAAGSAEVPAARHLRPMPKTAVRRRLRWRSTACGRGAATDKYFRLVLAGTSKFATNEYFPYVSDGELAVAMLRWLAADEATPGVQPQIYNLPESFSPAARCATYLSLSKCCCRSPRAVRRVGVVEAAVSRSRSAGRRSLAALGAALLILLLIAITMSGHWPELRQMVAFTPNGLIAIAPAEMTQVEIRAGQDSLCFVVKLAAGRSTV